MKNRQAFLSWVLVSLTLGCGGSSLSTIPRLKDRLNGARIQKVKKLAPDLVGASQNQLSLAELADERGDQSAAEDYTKESRFLLEASIVEAERVELEERRLRETRVWKKKESLALGYVEQRLAIEEKIAREKALVVVRKQIADALSMAASQDKGMSDRDRRESAKVLRKRAQLLLTAAQLLGAPTERVSEAQVLINNASIKKLSSSVALKKSDKAFFAAQKVLADTRREFRAPSAEQRLGLLDGLDEAGFSPEFTEIGLKVKLGWNGRSKSVQEEQLNKIVHVVAGFPHGIVQLYIREESEKRALKTAQNMQSLLVKFGIERKQTGIDSAKGPTEHALVLPAY